MIDRFSTPSASVPASQSLADSVAPSLFDDVVRLHSVFCLSSSVEESQALADFVAAFRRFYAVLPSCRLPEFVAAAPFLAFVADRLDLLLDDSDVFGVWRAFYDAKLTIQRVRASSAAVSGGASGPSAGAVSPASPDSGGASIEDDSRASALGRVPSASPVASPFKENKSAKNKRKSARAQAGASIAPVPGPSGGRVDLDLPPSRLEDNSAQVANSSAVGPSPSTQTQTRAVDVSSGVAVAPPSAVDLPPSAITAAILEDIQEGASVRVVAARYGVEVADVRRVSSALGRVSGASGGD